MAILIFVAAMAIIAGMIWVMVRMERSHRQRMKRHREAWRAGGSVGLDDSVEVHHVIPASEFLDAGDTNRAFQWQSGTGRLPPPTAT